MYGRKIGKMDDIREETTEARDEKVVKAMDAKVDGTDLPLKDTPNQAAEPEESLQ